MPGIIRQSAWDKDTILPLKKCTGAQKHNNYYQHSFPWGPLNFEQSGLTGTWLYIILLPICIQEQKVPWSLLHNKLVLRSEAYIIAYWKYFLHQCFTHIM